MTLKLGVIGDPVAHSLSPAYHRAFLAEYGLAGTYEAIRVPAGMGAARIDELRAAGYRGLNVTTPLKAEAYARADVRDAAAEKSGSVNTLVLGTLIGGYNTDGPGALGALREAGLADLAGKTILVLGAGPTARAVTFALTGAAANVVLWNRSPERAHVLAQESGARPFEPGVRPDAVFAALPPAVAITGPGVLAALCYAPLVIDANYGPRATLGTLLRRDDVHDGRAMLRASARASFEIFRAAR